MRCAVAQRLVIRRVSGEPIGWREGALDRHLVSCSGCRDFAEIQQGLHEQLVSCLPVPPVPDRWPAILDAARAPETRSETMAEWLRRAWSFRPGLVMTVATLVVVFAIGVAAATLLQAARDDRRLRNGLECAAFTEAIGDFPAGSPGLGLAELMGRHLRAEFGGRSR